MTLKNLILKVVNIATVRLKFCGFLFLFCFSHNLTFSILEDLTYAIKGTKEINYLKPHEDNITLYLISSALSGLSVWLHPYCVYILRVYVF